MVMASYTSAWILLTISILIPLLVIEPDGTIAVWVFPFIVLEVFFTAMIIYSAAVLIQYGWRDKGNE